jgi:hypothetical protein
VTVDLADMRQCANEFALDLIDEREFHLVLDVIDAAIEAERGCEGEISGERLERLSAAISRIVA